MASTRQPDLYASGIVQTAALARQQQARSSTSPCGASATALRSFQPELAGQGGGMGRLDGARAGGSGWA